MKTNIYFAVILVLLISILTGCKKNKKPIYKAEVLNGTWERKSSSKPRYDSMVVSVDTAMGTIAYSLPTGYFTVGTTKWKSITPDDDSAFVYQELGSDNKYYNSKMTFIKNDGTGIEKLFLEINSNGEDNGSWQNWERR